MDVVVAENFTAALEVLSEPMTFVRFWVVVSGMNANRDDFMQFLVAAEAANQAHDYYFETWLSFPEARTVVYRRGKADVPLSFLALSLTWRRDKVNRIGGVGSTLDVAETIAVKEVMKSGYLLRKAKGLAVEHVARLVVTYDPEDDIAIQEFISTADSVYVPAMSDLEAIAQLQSDRDAYTEMTLALNTESRLKAVAAKRRHYHGKLKKDLANEALRKALGSPPLNDSMDSSATPSPQEKAADDSMGGWVTRSCGCTHLRRRPSIFFAVRWKSELKWFRTFSSKTTLAGSSTRSPGGGCSSRRQRTAVSSRSTPSRIFITGFPSGPGGHVRRFQCCTEGV